MRQAIWIAIAFKVGLTLGFIGGAWWCARGRAARRYLSRLGARRHP